MLSDGLQGLKIILALFPVENLLLIWSLSCMKKIGVVSDTHLMQANDFLREISRDYFSDADLIIHAGDVVSLSVLDVFYKLGKDMVVVSGNMDHVDITASFPPKQVLKIGDISIGIIHGWGSPVGIRDRIKREFKDVDVIVYGHTHQAFNQVEDGILFFNPGSPTDTRFTKENSIGIIYVNNKKVRGELIVL